MDTFIRGGGIDLSDILKVDSIQLSAWSGEYKTLFEELDNYSRNGYSCVIFGGTDKAAKILAEDLHDKGYKADYAKNPKKFYLGGITVVEGILSAGFDYPEEKIAVLTPVQALHRQKPPHLRRNSKRAHRYVRSAIFLRAILWYTAHTA